MSLPLPTLDFCQQLFFAGVLVAERWPADQASNITGVVELIRQVDEIARRDAPCTAPPLDIESAQWGLSVLAWSVNLLVDRANADTSMPDVLAKAEPTGTSPSHHWSVDLSLRYIGEVLARARAAASADAFVAELDKICARWPLCAVGTQLNCDPARQQVIDNDNSLRRMLRERRRS